MGLPAGAVPAERASVNCGSGRPVFLFATDSASGCAIKRRHGTRLESSSRGTSLPAEIAQLAYALSMADGLWHTGSWTRSTPIGRIFALCHSPKLGPAWSRLGSTGAFQPPRMSTSVQFHCYENPMVTRGTCPNADGHTKVHPRAAPPEGSRSAKARNRSARVQTIVNTRMPPAAVLLNAQSERRRPGQTPPSCLRS